MNFEPGLYEVISNVNIRREPRILPENIVGKLTIGKQRTIYSVITDEHNYTWGRISFADAAGVSEWVCMKDINREFVKLVKSSGSTLDGRLERLESWARTKGYTG